MKDTVLTKYAPIVIVIACAILKRRIAEYTTLNDMAITEYNATDRAILNNNWQNTSPSLLSNK